MHRRLQLPQCFANFQLRYWRNHHLSFWSCFLLATRLLSARNRGKMYGILVEFFTPFFAGFRESTHYLCPGTLFNSFWSLLEIRIKKRPLEELSSQQSTSLKVWNESSIFSTSCWHLIMIIRRTNSLIKSRAQGNITFLFQITLTQSLIFGPKILF